MGLEPEIYGDATDAGGKAQLQVIKNKPSWEGEGSEAFLVCFKKISFFPFLMWTILNSLLDLLQYFCFTGFFFFWPGGMWDLAPCGNRTRPPFNK